MLQLALERTRTQLYSAVLSRTHVGSQLLVFTRCSEYTAHRRTPALTLAYSFTSLATTAPPTGLSPHWIRYPRGMVHVGSRGGRAASTRTTRRLARLGGFRRCERGRRLFTPPAVNRRPSPRRQASPLRTTTRRAPRRKETRRVFLPGEEYTGASPCPCGLCAAFFAGGGRRLAGVVLPTGG